MVTREELINGWLKYHNTTAQEVVTNHPEEAKSGAWFSLYKVSQEQHDEWVVWAKALIRKKDKISKKMLDRNWPYIFLDLSPTVLRDEDIKHQD